MTQEVHAKLVMDDAASAALGKIKGGLMHASEKAQALQHEFSSLTKQALATAAGFQLSGFLDTFKEMVGEGFHAAVANENQIKSLAGLVAMTDKTGMSFEETMHQGSELKEQLEKISVGAGATADSVIDAFSLMAERSQKSKEEIVDLTEKMAVAARGLPGGVGTLAGAFRDLETGIVRPRNALVQLMRQTGVVEGTAKKIAKGLTGMLQSGDETQKAKVFELAEQAMGRMAAKMKNAPLTFQETVNGLKTLRENIFEALGGPMVKAITPALENVKKFIMQHKEAIEKYAEAMGHKIGEWALKAGEKFEKGFQYLMDHSDEIAKAIKEGAEYVKDVVEFVLAHRTELAILAGVKTAAPMVGGAIQMGGQAAQLGSMIGAGSSVGGAALGTGALAATAGLAAFAAAIVAVGAAAWQGYKLHQEMARDEKQNENARLVAMKKLLEGEGELTKAQLEQFDAWRKANVEEAHARGESTAAAGMAADALWNERMARKANVDALAAAAAAAEKASETGGDINAISQPIVDAYNKAMKDNNETMMKYIAGLLDGSAAVRAAFVDSSDKITGGMDKLMEKLSKGSAEDIKNMLGTKKKGDTPLAVNFNVGKMEIKQDFRDQDPDRVAVVFKRDLGKNAMNRLQARGATPFGV